jgi:nicotinate phosphoribosyltransferase
MRLARPSGTVVEEVIYPAGAPPAVSEQSRVVTVPLVSAGEPVVGDDLDAAKARVAAGLKTLPWEGLKLSRGEPAIPTRMVPPGNPT